MKPGWKTTEILWPAVLAGALVAAMATGQSEEVITWLAGSLAGSSSAYSVGRSLVKRAALTEPTVVPVPSVAVTGAAPIVRRAVDDWPAAVVAAPPRPV